MKDPYAIELFEQLVREHHLAHNKFTECQLAEVIRQMLLAGDFERHVNVLHQQQIVYIPYARLQAMEFERDATVERLRKLEATMEAFLRETGWMERIEIAEARSEAAESSSD